MRQLIKKNFTLTALALFWPMVVCAGEVQIQNLSDFSVSSYGTHTLQQTHLWENSDPIVIQKLLMQIADRSLKQTEKERLIRLLTADTGPFIWQTFQQSDVFLVWRMQTLFDVGAFESVIQTIQSLAPTQRSLSLSSLLFNALLMKGQAHEACALLDEKETGLNTDERRIVCLLAQGKKSDARLQYELYRENNTDKTDWMYLGDIVLRERPLNPDFKKIVTPETIFLWILYGQVPLENQKSWVQEALVHLKPDLVPAKVSMSDEQKKTFSDADLIKLADLKPEEQSIYPMDVYRAFGQAVAQQRHGEAVLWGILLLSQSDFYRPEITTLMDEMMGEGKPADEQIH